jgi:mRNA interferase HigB
MRIIARKTLVAFWTRHPDSAEPLKAWFKVAGEAVWKTPQDVKAQYLSASILKGGRVVFNIAGNKYRLVAWINFDYGVVYIRFVGTHRDYDAIDAQEV